jgi:AAA domain-containing protein/bifunctional DNA primase/polymerase-like protein
VSSEQTPGGERPGAPGPYEVAHGVYWSAGWRGILPLPAGQKHPPPKNWTGADAPWPSYPDVMAWAEGAEGRGNIGLRVPEHVLGIDVDDYDGKGGGATFARLVEQYGPLPATWAVSSREDETSGIRMYRIPTGLAWPGDLGPGIELVQYRHRYAVAWPSVHPDTGRIYTWQRPDGINAVGEVPNVDDLPDLPPAWVQGVTAGAAERHRPSLDLTAEQCGDWLQVAGAGPECREVERATERYLSDLAGRVKARHEIGVDATARLTLLASEGHTGALAGLRRFHAAWSAAVMPDRGRDETIAEFGRLIDGAVRQAAARPEDMRSHGDPCASPLSAARRLAGLPPSAPAGPGPGGMAPLVPSPRTGTPLAPPVWPSAPPVLMSATVPAQWAVESSPETLAAVATALHAQQPDNAPIASAPADVPGGAGALVATQPSEAEAEALAAEAFRVAVEHELLKQRVRDEARRQLRRESIAGAPELIDLGELLATPDPEVRYRIDGLWPSNGRIMLTAAFKAGKSTLVQNVVRCLVDGGELLGKHEVQPVERRVVLIDDELDVDELRQWLREQGIRNVHKVAVIPLRGKVGTFDITDATVRAEWARRLAEREADVVILDCLRPVLDAIGLDEHSEAGRFLTAFDALLDESGAREAIVVHHAGHEGERARGDSRLRDWPDAEWRLVREKTDGESIDPSKPRFFAAYGRRVDVPEGKLDYSPSDRRLYYTGGSRADQKITFALESVIRAIREADHPLSGREIEAACADARESRNDIRKALREAIRRRLVTTFDGPHRATLHRLTTPGDVTGKGPE